MSVLTTVAHTVRTLSADAVESAKSGHPGLPLGCAEIGTALFADVLRHDPTDPAWPDRDRFVLSAGHGSMLLYSLLHLSGYDVSLDDLKQFRQLGSRTPGHPEYGYTPGVETTTGPLGQGFGNAVGMALAERMLAARYNRPGYDIVDHYTYVLAGDGDMQEGVASEAASLAGHLKLHKLIVIYDDNKIQIDGPTDLAFTESVPDRFKAYGWSVEFVDGHDIEEVVAAVEKAKQILDQPEPDRGSHPHWPLQPERRNIRCARRSVGRRRSRARSKKRWACRKNRLRTAGSVRLLRGAAAGVAGRP